MHATEKPGKKKTTRRNILLSVLLVMVFLVTAALWYWNTNKNSIIRNKLEKAIREKTDSLYNVGMDTIDLDETAGVLEIKNLYIAADSLKMQNDPSKKPAELIDLRVASLKFTGLKTSKALIREQIVAGKLVIEKPVLVLNRITKEGSEDILTEQKLYKKILGEMKFLQVDTLEIRNADIISYNRLKKKKRFEIKGLTAQLSGVRIDSLAANDPSRFLFSEKILVQAKNVNWPSPKGYYEIVMNNIEVNTTTTEATVEKLSVIPQLSVQAFVSKMPYLKDRIELNSNSIRFTGLDMRALMRDQLIADKLIVSSASCEMYRDLSMKRNTAVSGNNSLFTNVKPGEWLFYIKEIKLVNSSLSYREKTVTTKEIAEINFSRLNATVKNMTNIKKLATTPVNASLNALLLGHNPVSINGVFNTTDPSGKFKINGKTGSMDATLLNPLLEAEAMAKIREGYIRSLDFSFTGNRKSVQGTVNILYDNFHLDVLEKDPGATKKDRKFLTSIFANIKAKNSNPRPGKPPRIATVTINRLPGYSFANATWRAVSAGISDITGINF